MGQIVVTGTGLISSAGIGAGPVLDAMDSGVHFFNRPQEGKRSLHPSFPWPEASLENPDVPWPAGSPWPDLKKYANASAHQAVAVARLAIDVSGMADEKSGIRCGTIVASGNRTDELGPLLARLGARLEEDPRPLAKLLYDEIPDYSYLRGIPCQIGQFVCLAAGYRGSNVAAHGEASASGLGAVALAVRILQSGELDRVLVVGVGNPVPPSMLVAFDTHDPLGTAALPGRGPFDVGRAGTLLGHGAAALVFESEESARLRGATSIATVLGCETVNATTREIAIRQALEMTLEEVPRRPGFWWAHGSGSVPMDLVECRAAGPLVAVPTTSSKGTIGNVFESAGLIDIVLAVEALARGEVPPVGLLQQPDPQLGDVDFVVATSRPLKPGTNTALVTALDQRVEAAGAIMLAVDQSSH
jgi:3-oxoacyl-[acyl-carrier-protein] synthase II